MLETPLLKIGKMEKKQMKIETKCERFASDG